MDVDGSETDTPPHTIKNISFMDAASLQRQPLRPHIAAVYRECMKNHAAEIGGHAVDGCGEFMQSPSSSSSSSSSAATSLACAACGCHRNFHRRDPESTPTSAAITPPHLDFRHPPLPKRFSLSLSPSRSHSPSPRPEVHAPQVLYGLAEAAVAEDSRRVPITPVGRKRHRTRFSEEQKEKMQAFAAESGWRIQKSDEAAVREFCREVGVPRGVLKVWMHNNKNTFCKKEINGGGSILNDGGINFESSGGRREEEKKCDEIHEHGSGVHFNGSSSS